MKNNIWFIIACILVFCVGYNLNDTAVSFQKYKVAVVDVPEILSHSEEIQELKRQQDKDMEELNILISKAQNEIINEKRKDKLIEKEASYRKQIETKKTEIDKKYNAKLEKVSNNFGRSKKNALQSCSPGWFCNFRRRRYHSKYHKKNEIILPKFRRIIRASDKRSYLMFDKTNIISQFF